MEGGGSSHHILEGKRYIVYIESGKTPCPNFVRFQEGPKQKFTVKELCVRDASLQHYRSSDWV
jgi:hypothetical protein